MSKRITIKDIAKMSGVGVGTVSRVLNGGSVKPETRKVVMNAIKKLGYTPNVSARRLAGGKTMSILVLTPEIRTEFHWRLLESIDKTLDALDYQTVIYPVISQNRYNRLFNSNLFYEFDGVILCTLTYKKMFKKTPDFPVLILEDCEDKHDCVFLDNYYGGVLAAETLLERNIRNLYALYYDETSPLLSNENIIKRLEGFKDRLKEEDISFETDQLINADFFYGRPHERIIQILKTVERPGIFATTDNFAMNVLETAATLGKVPGKDFFIVGYDNQTWTERLELTTIKQPIEEMGEMASKLIVERIKNPELPVRHVKFQPSILRRKSA
ncbi:LacI family DNA-binding transcriptional regulator [Kosmotoga pacifica]|uniref:LacI family transcriptional regulator n=1 Tax=Kosmotoga pacifica TaxID=1330330 RepID=A0A0G2Z7S7_9BACT|nr:LacI family DNA-binding transcriptional regulator [Kosmotoga pacifica]AKI97602.1 LacI family transcriptional regulator [Kosmotoga pacifica]